MKVICFGELLIDFTSLEPEKPLWQVERFEKNVGGAPANVAIGLHHHGIETHLWSKVGQDSFGRFLIEKVKEIGLNTDGITEDPAHSTKLAFVGLDNDGDRYFEFHNIDSAERHIGVGDLNITALETASVFHFGGVALFGNRTYKTTQAVLQKAMQSRCLVSFDPNIRIDLMKNPSVVLDRFKWVLSFVDILKLSVDDWQQFFSDQQPQDLLKKGISLIILTEGARGARLITDRHNVFIPSEKVDALDTTGAGDAFSAAFLSKLVKYVGANALKDVDSGHLKAWGAFANHWGGQAVQHSGAVTVYQK